MKPILISCLLALIAVLPATAQSKPSTEAEAFFKKAMAQINPRHVAWVKSTAKSVQEQKMLEVETRKMATSYGLTFNFNSLDIEALYFLVMMEASKSAQQDLKAVMAKVKSINEQKQEQQALLSKLQQKRSITAAQLDSFTLLKNKTIALQKQQNPNTVRLSKSAISGNELLKVDVGVKIEEIKRDLVSMSELAEATQLKMQMLTDRMSKADSAASNSMKKFSEISGQIIGNMK